MACNDVPEFANSRSNLHVVAEHGDRGGGLRPDFAKESREGTSAIGIQVEFKPSKYVIIPR